VTSQTNHGQRTTDDGLHAASNLRLATDNGQRTTGSDERALGASVTENWNHAIGKVEELWYAGIILKGERSNIF